MTEDILLLLEGKWEDGSRPADLYARRVARRPSAYVPTILRGLESKQKRVQGGCAEIASRLSADRQELLYPHVDVFLRNLRARQPILRWEAVCTVGNLACVDDDKRIRKHVDEMVRLLEDRSIVLQGHAARALVKVAESNPKLAPRILESLLDAARFFPGTRIGYVIEAVSSLGRRRALAPRARQFVAPYAESDQASVARKAKKALRELG